MLAVLVSALVASAAPACKNKSGTLEPPRGADAWDPEYARFFDDGLTELPVTLSGRAPNDVRDQKRFGMRLGYSDLVILTEVSQSWSRGLGERRQKHYVEVKLKRVLLQQDRVKIPESETLRLVRDRPIPGDVQGKEMLLFLRWAPGEQPAYHHHLLIASDEMISTIEAMVKHAKREGQFGSKAERRKARRDKRKQAEADGDASPGANADLEELDGDLETSESVSTGDPDEVESSSSAMAAKDSSSSKPSAKSAGAN